MTFFECSTNNIYVLLALSTHQLSLEIMLYVRYTRKIIILFILNRRSNNYLITELKKVQLMNIHGNDVIRPPSINSEKSKRQYIPKFRESTVL